MGGGIVRRSWGICVEATVGLLGGGGRVGLVVVLRRSFGYST